jgi:diguanylate cyclase
MRMFGRRRAGATVDDTIRPRRESAIEDLPQATLAFCATHDVHPSPTIYETIYTYLSGSNASLGLAIAAEIERGTLSGPALIRIHEAHVHVGKLVQSISEIGFGIGYEVDQIADVVDAGIAAGSRAKLELSQVTDCIDGKATSSALAAHAQEIREIGNRQLATNLHLRESLRVTRKRLDSLERDLARQMAEANTDHLTRLPNRRAIDGRLARVFARAHDAGAPGCLIMIDIDHFKAINDTHGHDIGDSVIRMIAEVLRRSIGVDAVAARWGGEEFAVLFELSDRRSAMRQAETVRRALEAARWTRKRDGVPLGEITASFGVAERSAADTIASLTRRADAALYRAKGEGRNRCVFLNVDAEG